MSNFKNSDSDNKKYIYVQKVDELDKLDKLQIIHIIMGNDYNKSIKQEFNEPAIRYITKAIKIANQRRIELIEVFKDFIIKNSKKYLNGNGFDKNSLEIKKDGNIPTAIILKDNINFHLKSVFVDSKGINNFLAILQPNYTAKILKDEREKKDNYYIEVKFEMFGKITNDEIKSTKIVIWTFLGLIWSIISRNTAIFHNSYIQPLYPLYLFVAIHLFLIHSY